MERFSCFNVLPAQTNIDSKALARNILILRLEEKIKFNNSIHQNLATYLRLYASLM